jgi:hypothetical protein
MEEMRKTAGSNGSGWEYNCCRRKPKTKFWMIPLTSVRLLFLAMPLFLALGQGCFAASPATTFTGLTFEGMSIDDCVRWSSRALEENGYSPSVVGGSVIWGNKDPHAAIVFCNTAPNLTIVIATNAGSDDAVREREEIARSMRSIARSRGRDRRR